MKKDTYLDVLDELRELTMKKRAGYSPGDDPFKNFRMSQTFGVAPIKGIMVRVMDKMARLASLLDNPTNEKVGESLRDTMLDAGNYLLIGVAFMDEERRAKNEATVERIVAEIQQSRNPLMEHDCAEMGCGEVGLFDSAADLPPAERVRFGPDPEDVRPYMYEGDRPLFDEDFPDEIEAEDEGFYSLREVSDGDFFEVMACCPEGCDECEPDDDCLPTCTGCVAV